MRILLFLCLVSSALAQQQVTIFGSNGIGQLGKPRDLSEQTSNIDGNPYLLQDWCEGIVIQEVGSKGYKISKMNYNVLEEHIDYEQSGSVFYLEPIMFSQFILIKNNDSLRFTNKIGKEVSKAYSQILYKGKNTWLRKDSKSLINDPSSTYGTSKKKVIQDGHSFSVFKDNENIPIKLSKKFFAKRFNLQADDIQKYLDSKSLSFDQDSDLKAIFQWLDSKI